MPNATTMSTNFKPELIKDLFSKVRGHSSLAKLSQQIPIAFSGNDIMTFAMDGEVAIVGEGENKPAGAATIGPVTITPIKVVYQHRVSDEFLKATDEKALKMLEAFNDGFSRKIARGLDIMAMHGVNPADRQASGKIGTNHMDTVESVEYAGDPENALTDAVTLVGDYDVTGYALSKIFATELGKMKVNGVSQYPEFKMGGNPGKMVGNACDVNSTVTYGNEDARAYVGDFANAFKWGYADNIPLEIIPYGDPDGLGDLKRMNQVVLRAEAYIGWGILDKAAFARVVDATA